MRYLSVLIVCTLFSGSAFAQCISGNCTSGEGTYVYSNGAKYKGQFEDGKISGNGSFYFSNGNIYHGQWQNHERHGHGKMIFVSGDIYEGDFVLNDFEGIGIYYYHTGDRYQGQWNANAPHGEGIYSFADGSVYTGDFSQGKFFGQGKIRYADGSQYEGAWKYNKRHGKGTLYSPDGQMVAGVWEAGELRNRKLQLEANNTPSEFNSDNQKMRDCNRVDCMDGVGYFTYSDGTKYTGEFKQGRPEGQGVIVYPNGDRYEGGFRYHAFSGEGTMFFANGQVVAAVWEGGVPKKYLEKKEKLEEITAMTEHSEDVKIWALVVGVSGYNHMPALKYTDDDAYQVYAFLKSPEGGALPDDQVKILIDEDATKEKITESMKSLFLKADENDVIMMYFSGHGLEGSFLPYNFDGYNNVLSHKELVHIFDASKAKHKVCFADACHSGSLLAMKSPLTTSLERYYNSFDSSNGGTAFLMSSKSEEVSLETSGLRQGIFSHYLIRGLKGEADLDSDKIVNINELYQYTNQHVRDYTQNRQTPSLAGSFDRTMPVAMIR